jgi:ribosomal protein S18 acetylase RimI-like enzyme
MLLLAATLEQCRQRKIQRLSLHVDPTRTAVVALYWKGGF